jgi:uncharacterized protein (TIGR03435 family)
MKKALLLAIALAASSAMLRAQAPSNNSPTFDVAAIKPNTSADQQTASYVTPGGRYTATNVTLRALLKTAFGLHDTQLVGGPNWIDTDRWDITAKAEGYSNAAAFRDQARLMLRPLLTDRFKLTLRREQRDLPAYALVLAKPGGELGPQFRRNDEHDCAGPAAPTPTATGAAEPALPLPCGAAMFRTGHLAARAMALSNLVFDLARWADRVVVDRTGLTGKFDWEIQWVADELTVNNVKPPEGPSLFGAVRDQAGLRLESSRSPIDVLVIEHAERAESD